MCHQKCFVVGCSFKIYRFIISKYVLVFVNFSRTSLNTLYFNKSYGCVFNWYFCWKNWLLKLCNTLFWFVKLNCRTCKFGTLLKIHKRPWFTNCHCKQAQCLIASHIRECVVSKCNSNKEYITRLMGLHQSRYHPRVISSSGFYPGWFSRQTARWHCEVERFWASIDSRWSCVSTNSCFQLNRWR